MNKVKIFPSKLRGQIAVPASKSHTMRALLFALMARGKSRIQEPLVATDTVAMLDAIRHFGAVIDMENGALIIEGVGGKLLAAEDVIQCGNSGQVLRFLGALAALSEQYTILTGDLSIRHSRPVAPLLDALTQLGAMAISSRGDGYAPIVIKGPLRNNRATLDGADSQPVSGLLMLGAFAPLELHVQNPGEKPWINLTLSWFDRLGIPYENDHFEHYKMKGGSHINGFDYKVAGDFSSAAFPLVAAAITGSEITLDRIDMNDPQGDRAIIKVLETMGAKFEYSEDKLTIKKGTSLRGATIDVNDLIDALPILAVAGCFAEGKTTLINGAIARHKESDRITTIAEELQKMGADIVATPDGLIIHPKPLQGHSELMAHHDHRIAMALTVASLGAGQESTLHGIECISKSYPNFFQHLKELGAKVEMA